MDILAGTLFGIAAAFLQACAFAASARYVRMSGKAPWTLVAPSFLVMGVIAFAAMPFCLPTDPSLLPFGKLAAAGAACMLFAIFSNGLTFLLQRRVESSRTTPLLALKVPMLAAFCALVPGERITPGQWLGVALVVAASFMLCGAGRRIGALSLLVVMVICAGFCASDYCIQVSFDLASGSCGGSLPRYSLFTLCVMYAIGGVGSAFVMLPALLDRGRRADIRWRLVCPYAVFWITGIGFLFICFAMCGIVHGTIIQSLRGLIATVIGYFVARSGESRLEERVPRPVFVRRIIATALISAAIALYALAQ